MSTDSSDQSELPNEQTARFRLDKCSWCGSYEMWILDCYLHVPCPEGDHTGVHLHGECGACGTRMKVPYDDNPYRSGWGQGVSNA